MKITRIAVADGKAVVYLDAMPDTPVIISEGQELWIDENSGSVNTLWFEEPATKRKDPLARWPWTPA